LKSRPTNQRHLHTEVEFHNTTTCVALFVLNLLYTFKLKRFNLAILTRLCVLIMSINYYYLKPLTFFCFVKFSTCRKINGSVLKHMDNSQVQVPFLVGPHARTCVRQLWTLSPRLTTPRCARRDRGHHVASRGRTGQSVLRTLKGGLKKRFFSWSSVELSTFNLMVGGPPRVTGFVITKRDPAGPTSDV
jgi:hypothetical protein